MTLRRAAYPLAITALILLCAVSFGWLSIVRTFDPDEFQHLQFAWLIGQGLVPYRDVFEHHTPLYHYLLAPFLKSPDLMTNPESAVQAVQALRLTSAALSVLLLTQTAALARRYGSQAAAFFAAALLAGVTVFIEKGIEIRPDQLSGLFLMAAALALGLSSKPRTAMLLTGFFAALAVLAGQKALLAAPGFAIAAFLMQEKAPLRTRLQPVLWQIAGGLLAFLPAFVYFDMQGALSEFVRDNFLLGSHWPRDPKNLLWVIYRFLRLEPLLALLSLSALALTLRDKRLLPITAPLLALAVFMPLFPVVQRQYLFLLLPFMAIHGGLMLDRWLTDKRLFLVPLAGAILTLHVVAAVAYEGQRTNEAELATLRTVITQSPPQATILRSWSTGAAFRKPAFRYFSLNGEFQSLLTADDIAALRATLQNPLTAPTLIEMDEAMQSMPPSILKLIEKGWEPLTATLYKRKSQIPLTQSAP